MRMRGGCGHSLAGQKPPARRRRSAATRAARPARAAMAATSSAGRAACSPGIGTAITSRASPLKWARKAPVSLVDSVPQISDQRARRSLLEIGHRLGEHAAARLVVGAVEPDLGARRGAARSSGPARSRCSRAGHCAFERPRSKARLRQIRARSAAASRPPRRRCRTDAGRAGAAGGRSSRPVLVLEDEPAVLARG